ncbi:conserved hypothetical protein [Vibrio phage 217E38-1]|nr:conserved hypothetical protein [Vibrio phage 217E38-1]
MNYKELLKRSYEIEKQEHRGDYSVKEYLSDHIFEFTTYCGGVSEHLTGIAVDVCEAISNKTTFEFISEDEKHIWFITMCNMPFFYEKISWGSSIRGAWWEAYKSQPIVIDSCGLFDDKEEQIDKLIFESTGEWEDFIKAVIEMARE